MEADNNLKLAYKPAEAAKLLGIGLNAMYNLIHSHRIKSIRVGKSIIIPRKAIIDFLSVAED